MKTKELLEARWKVLTFALLALLAAAGNIAMNQFGRSLSGTGNTSPMLQDLMHDSLATTFNAVVWSSWFATNGPAILALCAVVLGGGLVASEVSKGTIFFLLSKPVSRDRILLTKYGVSAGLLLVVSAIGGLAIALASIVAGHPQDLPRLLIATTLLWLTALFPLGLSLFFSIISPDQLRPLVFSLLITAVLVLLPMTIPNGANWSLGHYWSNQNTYLTGGFPLTEYLVCFITALIPLLAALVVFRRKTY